MTIQMDSPLTKMEEGCEEGGDKNGIQLVIIYQMYRFIATFSYKRCTGNSALLIETAHSKHSPSFNNIISTVDFIKSNVFFISKFSVTG